MYLIKSIILCVNLKVALRMSAGGAKLGRVCTNNDMSAVAAFPNLYLALFEYGGGLYIFEKGSVTLLMMLFDSGYETEFMSQFLESFFFGCFGKALVHIGPFVVFAFGCGGKVSGSIAETFELFEP